MAPEGSENIIVGKYLIDFLSLGYQVSFATLPALAYSDHSRRELISNLVNRIPAWEGEDPQDIWTIAQRYLSELLEKEFDLKPWDAIESKLADLAHRYLHLVKMQDLTG